jgi:hypothetical protein
MIGLARFDLPTDLPTVDTVRARQIAHLGVSGLPVLNALNSDERDALFASLSVMVKTTDYHAKRFDRLVANVNERRKKGNALITHDFSVEYAIFEAAAALSAMRSAVDEIIFIAARVSGVPAPELKEKKWQTNNVMLTGFDKAPEFKMPAVEVLRARLAWYQELNDYRNVYRHRGCRDTLAAYFPLDSDFPEAKDGARNVMLLPDRPSLEKNTRADKWTYTQGVRLEPLLERALRTFEECLDELIAETWGGPAFLAQDWVGSIPPDQQPNMMLVHARPALTVIGQNAYLPLFSSRELASNFAKDSTGAEHLHLAELTPNEVGLFGLDVSGYKDRPEFVGLTGQVIVALDPIELTERGCRVRAHEARPLAAFLTEFDAQLLGIPRTSVKDADRLFVWRVPNAI